MKEAVHVHKLSGHPRTFKAAVSQLSSRAGQLINALQRAAIECVIAATCLRLTSVYR